ncbi:hypothetical protein FRC03_004578 [Tulasnella sp. 419]|nr:hypothetical protein FRC02_008186 [Tulasnella sp. 418]KAG8962095.1 hypothetical protein FRC03_004578 [Tulasnella sp. 419]
MSPTNATTLDKQSLDYVIRSGLAGGIAGCVAKTAVAPLDRVKILFQASNPEFLKFSGSWRGVAGAVNTIYHDGGIRGLLQGHSATLVRVFPYAAIRFMAYEQLAHILMPTKELESPGRRFVAGSTAGTISVLFTYPLELIRVRLAYEIPEPTNSKSPSTSKSTRPSVTRIIRTIYNEGSASPVLSSGPPPPKNVPPLLNSAAPPIPQQNPLFTYFPILKFYRGFSVTLLGIIPYAGTSFLVYGSLRSYLYPRDPKTNTAPPRSAMKDLVIGAISGVISQTVSYPFEVVRRRMQVGGLTRPYGFVGWKETVQNIWKANGWRGFYVGLSIGYVKVVPMTAISFMTWEWCKVLLHI